MEARHNLIQKQKEKFNEKLKSLKTKKWQGLNYHEEFKKKEELKKENISAAALVSADTLLRLPDFRSGERTFQTITALKNILPEKRLLIQTYNPENSVINYAANGNWRSFCQEEVETRKLLGYPPFSQIIKLTRLSFCISTVC